MLWPGRRRSAGIPTGSGRFMRSSFAMSGCSRARRLFRGRRQKRLAWLRRILLSPKTGPANKGDSG